MCNHLPQGLGWICQNNLMQGHRPTRFARRYPYQHLISTGRTGGTIGQWLRRLAGLVGTNCFGCWRWLDVGRQQQRMCGRLKPVSLSLAWRSSGDNYCGSIGMAAAGRSTAARPAQARLGVPKRPVARLAQLWLRAPTCTTAKGPVLRNQSATGVGNSLNCGTNVQQSGWTCQDSLCRGPNRGLHPPGRTTANGDQYCGIVGDGCGHSLDCGSTCKQVWLDLPRTTWQGRTGRWLPWATMRHYSAITTAEPSADGCGNSLACAPPAPDRMVLPEQLV